MPLLIPEADIYQSLCALVCTRSNSHGLRIYKPFFSIEDYNTIALQCGFDSDLKTVAKRTALYYAQNKVAPEILLPQNQYQGRWFAENTARDMLQADFEIATEPRVQGLWRTFFGARDEMVGRKFYHTIQEMVLQTRDNADKDVADLKQALNLRTQTLLDYDLGLS